MLETWWFPAHHRDRLVSPTFWDYACDWSGLSYGVPVVRSIWGESGYHVFEHFNLGVIFLWLWVPPDMICRQLLLCVWDYIWSFFEQDLAFCLLHYYAVAQWLDHSLAVRKFPGSYLVRTSPVHPVVKGYPISYSERYCPNASIKKSIDHDALPRSSSNLYIEFQALWCK